MMMRLGAVVLLTTFCADAHAQVLITTNKEASTASIIDLASGVVKASLPTGKSPHELAVSRDGKLAVVTDYGGPDNTLTVIDVPSRSVLRKVSFAPHSRPHGAVFLPDNRTLVVTAEREGLLVLVDVIEGKVTGTKRTGSSVGHMVALSPDAKTAYVANITPGNLSIIDIAGSAEPIIVPVGIQTEGIGLSPDGRSVWMGSNTTGKVFIIDVAARKVIDSLQTSGFPYRIGFTPDGKTALVTNPESNELRIIDVATRKIRNVVDMRPTGVSASLPQGIAVSRSGDKAWITLGSAAMVAEVEIATGKVLRWLASDAGPDGVVCVH
jgi:YVTN family beta-propeller protein